MYKVLFLVSLFLLNACSPNQQNSIVSQSSALQMESPSGIVISSDVDTYESTGSDVTVTYTVKSNSTTAQTQNITLADGTKGFSLLTSVCSNFSKLRACTVRAKFSVAGKANGQYVDQMLIGDLSVPLTANLNKPGPVDPNSIETIEVSDGVTVISSIDLGAVASSGSVTKALVLKDLSKSMKDPLTVTSSNPDFKFLTSVCTALSLNSSTGCSIRLQFAGAGLTAGVHTGSIKVGAKNIPVSATVQSVVITGTPTVQILNDSLVEISSYDFGSLATNQKSALNIKMKNTGTGAAVSSVQLSGSAFYATGSNCTSVLNAGATCSLTLNVNSSLSGVQSGTLSFGGKTLSLTVTLPTITPPTTTTYTLTLTQPANGVLSANKLTFNAGETANISLSFDSNVYQLSAWTGDCASVGVGQQCSLVMNANKTVSATLSLKPVPSLTMGQLSQVISGSPINLSGQATNIAVGTPVSVSVNMIPYIFAIPPTIKQVSTIYYYSIQLPSASFVAGTHTITVSSGGASVSRSVEILEAPVIEVDPINEHGIIFQYNAQTVRDNILRGRVTSGGSAGQSITLNYYGNQLSTTLDSNKAFEITIPQGSMAGCCGNQNTFPLNLTVGSNSVSKDVNIQFYTYPDISISANGGLPVYQDPNATEPIEIFMTVAGDSGYVPDIELMIGSKNYTMADIETVSETSYKLSLSRADLNALMSGGALVTMNEKKSMQMSNTLLETRLYPTISVNVPNEITINNQLEISGTASGANNEAVYFTINGMMVGSTTTTSEGHFSFYQSINQGMYLPGQILDILVTHASNASGSAQVNVLAAPELGATADESTLIVAGNEEQLSEMDNSVVVTNWTAPTLGGVSPVTNGSFRVTTDMTLANARLSFSATSSPMMSMLSVHYVVKNISGVILEQGNADVFSSGAPVEVMLSSNYDPGLYLVEIQGTSAGAGVGITYALNTNIKGTGISRTDYRLVGDQIVHGNFLDGSASGGTPDQLVPSEVQITVTGDDHNPVTISQYDSSNRTVPGKYGTLTFNGSGNYFYTLNSGVNVSSLTEKEIFSYMLSDGMSYAMASIKINLIPDLTPAFYLSNTILTNPVFNAEVSLGAGANIVKFNVLGNDDLAGNGAILWRDFSFDSGDRLDLSNLFTSSVNSSNVNEYISVDYSNGYNEVYIDRDGAGTQYTSTKIATLMGSQISPEDVIASATIENLKAYDDEGQVELNVTGVESSVPYLKPTVTTSTTSTAFLGSGALTTANGTFDVAAGTVLDSPILKFTATRSGGAQTLATVNLTSIQIKLGSTTISSGNISFTTGAAGGTYSLGGMILSPGTYTVTVAGTWSGIAAPSNLVVKSDLTGTAITPGDFKLSATPTTLGNIFDGSSSLGYKADILGTAETAFTVKGTGSPVSLNMAQPSTSANIQGRYGVLTINGGGTYSYALSSETRPVDITEKETFLYTIFDSVGGSSSAKIIIGMNLSLSSTLNNISNVYVTPYPAVYTLGPAINLLTYRTLANDDLGGNGVSVWNDFSLGQDKISLSNLLVGWDGNLATVGSFISVQYVNNNTEVYVDRDGPAGVYHPKKLLTLMGVQATPQQIGTN